MRARRVLVAFASQSGSTATIAHEIAAELRGFGLPVDCLAVAEIDSLDPYAALVLGSGVFVRSRSSDGGGFLSHHAGWVADRPVWLFCAGPIGRGHEADGSPAAECPVMDVARAIRARGAAAFGEIGVEGAPSALDRPASSARVREWARAIAHELAELPLAAAS